MGERRTLPADDFDVEIEPRAKKAAGRASSLPGGLVLVTDVMSEPVRVRPDESIEDVARRLKDERQHAAVVVDGDDRLVGIVTRTDLLACFRGNVSPRSRIRDVLTPSPETVPDCVAVHIAAEMLCTANVHQLPVVSKDGKVIGMVTAIDLARSVATG